MAERRMFSKKIVGSARFLKMPTSTQTLYFHLGIYADDDGVVEAYTVMNLVGCTEDDLKLLAAKGFVRVLNDDLVSYITDWRENNKLRSDRKVDSIYKDLLLEIVPEAELLESKPRADLKKNNMDNLMTSAGRPADCLGEESIGQYSTGQESVGESKAYQPTASPAFSETSVSVSSPSLLCGTFGNVSLTQVQLDWLANKYPDDYMGKIDHLSEYMYDTGKTYKDHFRKIREWAEQDEKKKKNLGKTGEVEDQGYDLESESKRPIPPKPDNVDMTDEEWKIHIEKLRE